METTSVKLTPEQQQLLQKSCHEIGLVVSKAEQMQKLLTDTFLVARSHLPVLIMGPTGTGKELIARLIQHLSLSTEGPFIDVNCAAIPESLIESQFFGHEKGAFSGATSKHHGYLAMASQGILFLDEIAELPLLQQGKLLRVIESGQYRPLGSSQSQRFKGRIISATHHNLEDNVKEGLFRNDLYHRLNVFPLHVPALSERTDDIPELVKYFAAKHSPLIQFSPQALQTLEEANWPGNIRELKNTIERIIVVSHHHYISQATINQYITPSLHQKEINPIGKLASSLINLQIPNKLSAIEFASIKAAMAKADGNKSSAARLLGVHRKFIERKLKSYDDTVSTINHLYHQIQTKMAQHNYKSTATDIRKTLKLIEASSHLWQDSNKQLELILWLSVCLRNTQGWNNSELLALYNDADNLISDLALPEESSVVQFGLWINKLLLLDLEGALDTAQTYYNEGNRINNPNVMSQAAISLVNTYFWMGDYKNCRYYLQNFFDLYCHDARIIINAGHDLFVYYLMFKSLFELQIGKVLQAIKSMDELLNYADKVNHSFSLATAIQFAVLLYFNLGKRTKCYQLAEQLLHISTQNSFLFLQGIAELFLGHQLAMQGHYKQAKKNITTAFYKTINNGDGLILNSMHGIILAEIAIDASQFKQGLQDIEKSIALSLEKNELCYFPEQLVMRGRLKLLLQQHDNGYQDFIDANIKAREMGSLAGELKASYQLAKFYCQQKNKHEAIRILNPIVLRYDEADSYADLVDAKKLLASL